MAATITFAGTKNNISTLHIKEAIVIKPAESTPTRLLPLSALDSQLFLRFTFEYLLVFNARSGLDQAALASKIKSAFARILVPYYPLAGRVRSKPDGLGLEVFCRGQGAVFVQAVDNSNVAISEFDKAPKFVTQWRRFLSFHVADVLEGAPLVVIQLTWLKDGAATLGVGFNHCVIDGIGSAEFLNSFSEIAASDDRVEVVSDFRPRPIWDRHLLDPIKPSFGETRRHHPEFNRVADASGFLTRFSTERLSPTSVIFDKVRQNELKRLANSTESGYTCFEVVAAHVWRSWARALNLSSNQILKLLFSINIRDRVKPSLPSGYYGNAFVLGCAQTTAKYLTMKGLGYAAMLIKRAKEKVDNGHVRSVIETVSQSGTSPDSVGVLIMSQWSKLGLERVDFGMGRPVHVGPICSDRYCLILPVHNQTDAVKVMVAIPLSGVDKYEHLVNNPHP